MSEATVPGTTAERLLSEHGVGCICGPGFKDRGLYAPECQYHDALEAMVALAAERDALERERDELAARELRALRAMEDEMKAKLEARAQRDQAVGLLLRLQEMNASLMDDWNGDYKEWLASLAPGTGPTETTATVIHGIVPLPDDGGSRVSCGEESLDAIATTNPRKVTCLACIADMGKRA